MSKKNILVVTTCFSPENAVGSVRLTKIVKFLIRNGYQVTVISPQLHEGSKIDNSLESKELDSVNRITVPQSKVFAEIFLKKRNDLLNKQSATEYIKIRKNYGITQVLKAIIFRYAHLGYTLLRNLDWRNQVDMYVKNNFKQNQFDAVFSSYPSLGAMWASKSIKKRKIAKKWIADFRDPINYKSNSDIIIYNINKLIQSSIIKHIDAGTFVTKGMITKISAPESISFYLPNGIDDDDLNYKIDISKISDSNTLNFSYVGSLYGGERDLSIIFVALNHLINEGILKKENVKFYYAGNEFDVLKSQASQSNVEEVLINKGYVTREESIQIQAEADISIIVSWNTENDFGVIPGKLYESFLMRKPIIGIVNGSLADSELSYMINFVNAGVCYEDASLNKENDLKKIVNFIQNKYLEKQEYKAIKHTYDSNVNKFYYKNIVEKLGEIL
ncbi:hypothetical protein [uncultured Pontibacter sp.]|uniref:hypothetical protein n=1 Tax=uncultured Pontibacter sp. TaxID=453356 RepID=UPI00261E8C39|nr:hypothetical protein [uncultured Pontibacter sp.]